MDDNRTIQDIAANIDEMEKNLLINLSKNRPLSEEEKKRLEELNSK